MLISRESYIVVSDLHFNSHKQNRFNYYQECLDVIEDIHRINKNIQADKKYLISLDDMVDRGKPTSSLYDKVVQLIKYLLEPFDGSYIALGNHSRTYHVDNPLFSFIQSFDTPALNHWKAKPVSLTKDIIVTDRLEFEDVEFVFRPYGTAVDKISEKMGILFMHDDLYPPGVDRLVPYVKHRYTHPLEKFDFVFNGHLHSIRTVWSMGRTQIHNLGSLLRTKSEEVMDTDLVRMVPVIYIDGGYFETIRMETITLPPREAVYKEEAYQEQHEVYEMQKERKAYKDFGKVFAFDAEPLELVDEAVSATRNFRVTSLWNKIKGELS